MSSDSGSKNPTRDLAATLYADFVIRATEVGGEGVKMSASAENLAKLSLKLAEVFVKFEEDSRDSSRPAKETGVDAASFADWMKK